VLDPGPPPQTPAADVARYRANPSLGHVEVHFRCSTQDERDFAVEILAHQIAGNERRMAEIDARLEEASRLSP
jgi:hypothetical protein